MSPAVRCRARAGWLLLLAAVGGVLFTVGLVVRVRCAVGRCPSPIDRQLFSLDAVGGLPRLFTTVLFVALTVLAVRVAVRTEAPARWWWFVVALGGVGLTVAKAVSVHSSAERTDGRWVTLVGALLITLVGLPLLWWSGRRWSVPAAGSVTVALAFYAAAALGLDQLTGLIRQVSSGPVALALATYVEEGGEAVTALVLVAVVTRWLPSRTAAPSG